MEFLLLILLMALDLLTGYVRYREEMHNYTSSDADELLSGSKDD